MYNEEEFYRKRYEEVSKKLADPVISNKIDNYITKISKLVNCDVELNFTFLPHMEDYAEKQESGEYVVPDAPTMKLQEVKNHLNKEDDGNLNVYIDPIYLTDGVNEICDILITTDENRMIIVPISNHKNKKK